jgi:hypothetical protein
MDWKHLLAYITGTVEQELLLRNEYLATRKIVSSTREIIRAKAMSCSFLHPAVAMRVMVQCSVVSGLEAS